MYTLLIKKHNIHNYNVVYTYIKRDKVFYIRLQMQRRNPGNAEYKLIPSWSTMSEVIDLDIFSEAVASLAREIEIKLEGALSTLNCCLAV